MTKAVSTKASKAKKTSGELNPTGGFRLFCQENRDEGDVLIDKFFLLYVLLYCYHRSQTAHRQED